MYKELFALVGIWSLFRFLFAGPKAIETQEMADEWDQTPVDARHIDHDLVVFASEAEKDPAHIGSMRSLQEKRNMVRATESRPQLDVIHFTRDNARILEIKTE